MGAPYRSVRAHVQELADRTVLAVDESDRRSFEFGERVYVVVGDDSDEQVGVVTWDPVARWVVSLEDAGSRLVPW